MEFKEIKEKYLGQNSKASYGLPKKPLCIPQQDEGQRGSVKSLVQIYENKIRESSKDAESESTKNPSAGHLPENQLHPHKTPEETSSDIQKNRPKISNNLKWSWLSKIESSQGSIINQSNLEGFSKNTEDLERHKALRKNVTDSKIAQNLDLKPSDLKLEKIEENRDSCEMGIKQYNKGNIQEDKLIETKKINSGETTEERAKQDSLKERNIDKEKSDCEEKKKIGKFTEFKNTNNRNIEKVLAKKIDKELGVKVFKTIEKYEKNQANEEFELIDKLEISPNASRDKNSILSQDLSNILASPDSMKNETAIENQNLYEAETLNKSIENIEKSKDFPREPKAFIPEIRYSRISIPSKDRLVLSTSPIIFQETPFSSESGTENPFFHLLSDQVSSINITEKSKKITIFSPEISPTKKIRKLDFPANNFKLLKTDSLISEIDVICINCYECVVPEKVDMHSSKCIKPSLEITEETQADIRIRKMLKSITWRKQSANELKFNLYCKLEELSLAIIEKSMSSLNIQDKLEEINTASFKINDGLPILILSKRLLYLLKLKGEFQSQENEKNLLAVYQEETERQKRELEKWKLKSEMLLQLAGNPAGQCIEIDSDLGSGRESIISFTSGLSDVSNDNGDLEDIEQVLQEISEEELEKHFYKICVRAKLALPKDHSFSDYPISELFFEAQQEKIPVSKWKEFISSKFK